VFWKQYNQQSKEPVMDVTNVAKGIFMEPRMGMIFKRANLVFLLEKKDAPFMKTGRMTPAKHLNASGWLLTICLCGFGQTLVKL